MAVCPTSMYGLMWLYHSPLHDVELHGREGISMNAASVPIAPDRYQSIDLCCKLGRSGGGEAGKLAGSGKLTKSTA